jgi:histidinol-phosphate aminotransferase
MHLQHHFETGVHPWLNRLTPYQTGKPIDETARELGLDPATIVKLASNENPLGPSPRAVEAMKKALEKCHIYPDGSGYYLRKAIAEKLGLDIENIVLGNGSNEIIELLGHVLLKPGTNIIAAEHAFVVYKLMAQLQGADCIEVPDPDFKHDLRAMREAITPSTRLIFVANPNNPTGTAVSPEELDELIMLVPHWVTVVVDEAYYEFLENPPDLIKHIRYGRNVVVMRTFSKTQGLAGLRIGYGAMPTHISRWLQRVRQPFNANLIAQVGALASLNDHEHLQKTVNLIKSERSKMQAALAELGIKTVPSQANFLLMEVGDGNAVFRALLQHGVIVRAMESYKLPAWIRVTIGLPTENERFLQELKKVLKK